MYTRFRKCTTFEFGERPSSADINDKSITRKHKKKTNFLHMTGRRKLFFSESLFLSVKQPAKFTVVVRFKMWPIIVS